MLDKILNRIKKFIPKKLFNFFQPFYHYLLSLLAAIVYRFPSRKIFVLGITGTKGKTSVLEITSAILEAAGYKTALASTLRFKINKETEINKKKMTMPGRFFVQKFLRRAIKQKCQYALLEMTSQGVLQSRHRFIDPDAMIFTNLSPEHIESHGSFENYKEAKMELFKNLEKSLKEKKIIITNGDDKNTEDILKFKADRKWAYGLNFTDEKFDEEIKKIKPANHELTKYGIEFILDGKDFNSKLMGEFNLYNILAAISFARSQSVAWEDIQRAIEKFKGIPGRVEFVEKGQDFKIVIDYAHTPDSLEKLYQVFQNSRKICVLGSAGGGRDKWKRPEMGKIAASYCDEVILTNEDPYDENPMDIISDISKGIQSPFKYKIVQNRKEAISEALKSAKTGDTVLITGKGSEQFIMGPKGTKIDWNDKEETEKQLEKIQAIK